MGLNTISNIYYNLTNLSPSESKYSKNILYKIMKQKLNNILILLEAENTKLYFTSYNKAGKYLNRPVASIIWAINHGNKFSHNNKNFSISEVDGTHIEWGMINVNEKHAI